LVPGSSVLIIDGSTEDRQVLRMALERRGVRIFEAARADVGLALARRHRPEIVVLDLELAAGDEAPSPDDFAAWANDYDASLILLGTARRHATAPPGEFIAKPYHYQPLVLKIEQLLGEPRQPLQRA
jgi:DNA-binding NtrC family response regulator